MHLIFLFLSYDRILISDYDFQLMLLFEREDAQSDAWLWASRKMGHQVNVVCSFQPDVVQKKITEFGTNFIVIDRRLPSRATEADTLCR